MSLNLWKQVPLKKLITTSIQNGYSPVCPEVGDGRWILGLGALGENGIEPAQKKPAPIEDKKVNDYLLSYGDFLVSRSNTLDKVGRAALFRGEIQKCAYPDLMMRFRVDENQVYLNYLDAYLRCASARKYFMRCAAGTSSSMVKINKKSLEKLPVMLPSIAEQKRIAEILEVWDGAIAIVEQLITAKQKLKNVLLHKMLEDAFELPETEKVKLREIASVKTGPFGSLLHESDYKKSGTPIITVEHLSENGILHKGLPLVSDEDKTRLKSYLLKEGDVVFSRVGSVDRSSVVSSLEDGWLFSGRLLRVRPNPKKVCFQYLNYYFHQPRFRHTIRSMAVGGTMPCLNTQILGGIQLTLPPIHIQQKIAAILATCDLDIQNYVNLSRSKTLGREGQNHLPALGKMSLNGVG